MKINNKYHLEQKVYLVTDVEQLPRVVVKVSQSIGNAISYTVHCCEIVSEHFECELSDEKNVIGDVS